MYQPSKYAPKNGLYDPVSGGKNNLTVVVWKNLTCIFSVLFDIPLDGRYLLKIQFIPFAPWPHFITTPFLTNLPFDTKSNLPVIDPYFFYQC